MHFATRDYWNVQIEEVSLLEEFVARADSMNEPTRKTIGILLSDDLLTTRWVFLA